MIRRRTLHGIVLLTILAGLSWVFSRPAKEPGAEPVDGLDTRLNYALHDFKGRLLNDLGEIALEIEAPLLRNDAASGIGTIEQPRIRIQQEAEEWYITAETGIIAADREQVTLEGRVLLVRNNELTGEQLDIATRDVVLDVTPRKARTDAGVAIRQDGNRLDAVGMKLDLINDRVELLSEVRAHYEVL